VNKNRKPVNNRKFSPHHESRALDNTGEKTDRFDRRREHTADTLDERQDFYSAGENRNLSQFDYIYSNNSTVESWSGYAPAQQTSESNRQRSLASTGTTGTGTSISTDTYTERTQIPVAVFNDRTVAPVSCTSTNSFEQSTAVGTGNGTGTCSSWQSSFLCPPSSVAEAVTPVLLCSTQESGFLQASEENVESDSEPSVVENSMLYFEEAPQVRSTIASEKISSLESHGDRKSLVNPSCDNHSRKTVGASPTVNFGALKNLIKKSFKPRAQHRQVEEIGANPLNFRCHNERNCQTDMSGPLCNISQSMPVDCPTNFSLRPHAQVLCQCLSTGTGN
jgi:hypothetical protein